MNTEELDISKIAIAAKAYKCKNSLAEFVKEFWDVVVGNELIWSDHMTVLCDEIEKVDRRIFVRHKKEYDLIINVPPGTSKTTIASIMATCWDFANMPAIRIVLISFSDDAVVGISDKIKLIMNSEKYKAYFPEVVVRRDVNNKHNFKTTKNGEFYAASVGGTITSKHFDKINVDDPIDPKKVESRAAQLSVNISFFDKTIPTRKVDKEVTPMVLIMQRLSTMDPTGHLLSKKSESIRHIVMPATDEYEIKPAELKKIYIDGLLDKHRLGRKVLADMEKDLGVSEYAGQFGQSPVPLGGNIIKKEWIDIVDPYYLPYEASEQVNNAFADTAYTDATKNDPSGLMTCFYFKGDIYITKYWSKRLEINDCVNEINKTMHAYCDYRSRLIIENKASGKSINQELKRIFKGKLNMLMMNVTGKKENRLRAFQGAIQSGKVKLIKGHWNEAFLAEITGFPNMPHDEAVDCLTMSLAFYLKPIQSEKRIFVG